ncbi:MAG: RidA family protein [Alphaproteobacteria bacterium]|nr:RidA family protein [Alphaproteobacteria bacterium]
MARAAAKGPAKRKRPPAPVNKSGRRVVSAKIAEPAPGSYSMCKRVGNHVYVSGQIASDNSGKVIGRGDAYKQAQAIFRKIAALMEAAGGTVDDVVKVVMYTTDMRHQPDIWKARRETFSGDFPTSTLICVTALFSPELLVEIEAVGYIDD